MSVLQLEDLGRVRLLTLNRPEVGNAISTQMGRDLLDLWTRLTDDAGDVRCVVTRQRRCATGDEQSSRRSAAADVGMEELFDALG